MVRAFALSLLLFSAPPAIAQTPAPDQPASVPLAATPEKLEQFAKSFSTPTHMTGKIARWDSGICPVTVGLPPQFTGFVTKRVRDVAAQVGAPVNAASSCKPNIEIVFTSTPQALLDNVRQHEAELLGYAESSAQKDRLATVTHPIQAWYTTQTKDMHGMGTIDGAPHRMASTTLSCLTCSRCPFCMGVSAPELDLPDFTSAVSGSNISNGSRSTFFHVIIVADSNRLAGYTIGPLADYISLLALTQSSALDACQPLSSIVNMLAPGCGQRASEMTRSDFAYLSGLYKMSPEKSLVFQRNEIASQMKETLGR